MTNIQVSIRTSRLPPGYSLYQCGDDKQIFGGFRGCSTDGCPGVVPLNDDPDTIFTDPWVIYVAASNFGMPLNAIIALMGTAKAMFNNTGIPPRRNVLTGSNLDQPSPRYDKFRTMVLNTHAGYDDGVKFYPLTMNGRLPPPVKDEALRPKSVEEINDTTINNYVYLPRTHRHLFVVCNNVKTKLGGVQSIFPFDNGMRYSWTGDNEMYSFLPFVSWFTPEKLASPLSWWNKVPENTVFPSPYRRVG